MDELQIDKGFVLLPRIDYFDFMKLLENAQYVITDGGSNQEELHYMGKGSLSEMIVSELCNLSDGD